MRAAAIGLVALTACGGGGGGPVPDAALDVEEVASGLSAPIALAVAPGDGRLFVAEKGGRVRIVEGGRPREGSFLDLHERVSTGNEQGLLGLAFHPGYAENGRFFVSYTDPAGDTRIVEYRVSADRDVADAASAWEILSQAQPFSNHNGGHITFGPDGMLYVGLGDGGSAFDPRGNGQSLETRLGKLLRLDVDVERPARYAAPPDNPFFSMGGAAADVWLYGLRNPWRFAFDRETGDLWIGDVGQQAWEELDLVPAGESGLNFGWNVVEGNDHCPRAPGTTCTLAGATPPVHDYDHDAGNAIVGGPVYRGTRVPELRGAVFFGDNGSGFVRSLRYQGAFIDERGVTEHPGLAQPGIATFAEDADGEILFCSISRGTCWRIVPRS